MSLRDALAPTPPMGWNSWDSFGMTVTEGEIEATASFMASHLSKYGWQLVVIDGGWSMRGRTTPVAGSGAVVPHDIDDYGRFIPALDRFPSAAGGVGFRAIADYLHARNLKFGIHVMRGIPREAVAANTPVLGTRYRARDIANTSDTCAWSTEMYGLDMSRPGAQAYYESVVDLYSEWKVDFIKADDMTAPYHRRDVETLSRALRSFGRREIVLSLSPGSIAFEEKDILHALAHCELWRFSPDVWDNWDGGPKHFTTLKRQFELCKRAAVYSGPGRWSDADMLPIGRIGPRPPEGSDRPTQLTKDEQITMMTLWLIARSPLFLGGHLPSLDPWTLDLLTNAEALAVNQRSWGNRVLSDDGEAVVWMANGPDERLYLALFNLSDAPRKLEVVLHLPTQRRTLRDLWAQKDLGLVQSPLTRALPPHGSTLLQLT